MFTFLTRNALEAVQFGRRMSHLVYLILLRVKSKDLIKNVKKAAKATTDVKKFAKAAVVVKSLKSCRSVD